MRRRTPLRGCCLARRILPRRVALRGRGRRRAGRRLSRFRRGDRGLVQLVSRRAQCLYRIRGTTLLPRFLLLFFAPRRSKHVLDGRAGGTPPQLSGSVQMLGLGAARPGMTRTVLSAERASIPSVAVTWYDVHRRPECSQVNTVRLYFRELDLICPMPACFWLQHQQGTHIHLYTRITPRPKPGAGAAMVCSPPRLGFRKWKHHNGAQTLASIARGKEPRVGPGFSRSPSRTGANPSLIICVHRLQYPQHLGISG